MSPAMQAIIEMNIRLGFDFIERLKKERKATSNPNIVHNLFSMEEEISQLLDILCRESEEIGMLNIEHKEGGLDDGSNS